MWTITRKKNHFSGGYGMLCKALLVSLLLLCVVVSQLAAWPIRSERKEASQTPVASQAYTVPSTAQVQTAQQTPSTSSSKESASELREQLSALQEDLTSSKKVTQGMRDDFADLIAAFQSYISLEDVEDSLAVDNSGKLDKVQGQLSDVLIKNAEQADRLAEIASALEKERGTKFFARVGGVIGFSDLMPTWGVSTSLGVRFGKGFLVEAGAQYMIGDFVSMPTIKPDLDKLQLTASVGWEW